MLTPIRCAEDFYQIEDGESYYLADDIVIDQYPNNRELSNVTIDGKHRKLKPELEIPIFKELSASCQIEDLIVVSDKICRYSVLCKRNFGVLKNVDVHFDDAKFMSGNFGCIAYNNLGVIKDCSIYGAFTLPNDQINYTGGGITCTTSGGRIDGSSFVADVATSDGDYFDFSCISHYVENSEVIDCYVDADIEGIRNIKKLAGIAFRGEDTVFHECTAEIHSSDCYEVSGIVFSASDCLVDQCTVKDSSIDVKERFGGITVRSENTDIVSSDICDSSVSGVNDQAAEKIGGITVENTNQSLVDDCGVDNCSFTAKKGSPIACENTNGSKIQYYNIGDDVETNWIDHLTVTDQ